MKRITLLLHPQIIMFIKIVIIPHLNRPNSERIPNTYKKTYSKALKSLFLVIRENNDKL